MVSSPNAVLQACRRFWSRESILHESAGEDFNEEEAADEEDGQEMDTTEPMLGATYWANLLGNYAGNLKGAQEGLDRKPSRKRNRTEKAAAAFAGMLPKSHLHSRVSSCFNSVKRGRLCADSGNDRCFARVYLET